MNRTLLQMSAIAVLASPLGAENRVLQAFEGDGFDDWSPEGSAFGDAPVGPSSGENGFEITKISGASAASSAHGGAEASGSLTSPEFEIGNRYLVFSVAGAGDVAKASVQLIDGEDVLFEEGGGGDLELRRVVWDLEPFAGRRVKIRLLDRDPGGVLVADHFVLTDDLELELPVTRLGPGGGSGDLVPTEAMPGMRISAGSTLRVAGDREDVGIYSPTALTFDRHGRVLVAETYRFRHGVEDNRGRSYWFLEDLRARTVEDRAAMFERWSEKITPEYLVEKSEQIRILSDQGEDGRFRSSEIFADEFRDPMDGTAAGVFAYEDTVYFACIPKIWGLTDADSDGKAEDRWVVEDGFGVKVSFSGHDLNGFALHPDGRIYGTIGDRGMNLSTRDGREIELPDEGAVFRFDPDGSNFELVHTGLRNPKEIAFDEFGNGFSVDNNSDQGDEARIVYVVEGGDSGWRMEHQAMHSHHSQIGLEERPPNRWMQERMWEPENPEHPAWLLPPVENFTAGPSGLTYHPGTGFLESELGRFLICDYRGSGPGSGIWSFRVEPEGAGFELADSRRFNWGAAATDVEYSWDGRVFVTDFVTGWVAHNAGRIYELRADEMFRAEQVEQVVELIRDGFEHRDSEELTGLLSHPDQRIRVRAQLALTRKTDAIEKLSTVALEGEGLARLHGVWGLGILARRGPAALPPKGDDDFMALPAESGNERVLVHLLKLVEDEDPEVRAQATKALGESGIIGDRVNFGALMADESPRVRMFAAIATGRTRAIGSLPYVWKMLTENDDKDPYLRHAGAYALGLLSTPQQLVALKNDESAALRLAAVIALGRGEHEEIAEFLHDSDPRVSAEVLRLIHDRGIEAVRGHVASLLPERPEGGRSEIMWRRLLHSAFRIGDATNLERVVAAALDPELPEEVRREALRLTTLWSDPPPVDQSLGRWNPLPERDPELATEVLQGFAEDFLAIDGELLADAIGVIEEHGLDLAGVSDERLRSLVSDGGLPGDARAKVLDLYASRGASDLAGLLVELAGADDDALALSAIRRLIDSGAPEAPDALRAALGSESEMRKQRAWELAGEIEDPAIAALFVGKLQELAEAGGRSPEAIELLDAAEQRAEPEVAEALAGYRAAVEDPEDPLSEWRVSLVGGNPRRGGRLFESHSAAQCMRCHVQQDGHDGGLAAAGPDLDGVATRGDREFLLESMIVPGAKVSSGFGLVSVTRKDGSAVAGILLEDNDEQVVVDVAGEETVVPRSEIQMMSEPISAMPPMGSLLTPAELRDLVAWLATRDGTREEEGERRERH